MSEVKTNKISSLASNNDITIDPDGTGDTIIASGNFGIGTSSPDVLLDIEGASATQHINATSGNANTFYQLAGTTTGSIEVGGGNSVYLTANNASGNMYFRTGGANTRMTVSSNGNVGVGTDADWATFTVLNAAKTASDVLARFLGTSTLKSLIVRGDGDCENSNNSYGALSDVKLKENIVDATPKLADLMRVQVRNYNLIGTTNKQIGVVAQELEQIFPNMIKESPDTDNEGQETGETTKSVKYSVFVPILIKALQEQQETITALEARITALEAS